MKKKLTLRQAQAIRTKKKIYNVAIELMDKKGFEKTTIEEISKKAGVSVGAFYHYYKSKNAIFFEVYKVHDEYFKNEVAQQLTQENSFDQIITFFKFYGRYDNNKGLDFIRQLYNTQNKFFIDHRRYMYDLLERIIINGQEKNEIIMDMTAENISDYFLIMARGIVYDWCLHEASYDLAEMMEKQLRLLSVLFKTQKV